MDKVKCFMDMQEIIGYRVPCPVRDCPHNMFYEKLKITPHETKASREYLNCMCLLDEALTLEQIGEMWGLTRERIRQVEERAIKHFRRNAFKMGYYGMEALYDQELSRDQMLEQICQENAKKGG